MKPLIQRPHKALKLILNLREKCGTAKIVVEIVGVIVCPHSVWDHTITEWSFEHGCQRVRCVYTKKFG